MPGEEKPGQEGTEIPEESELQQQSLDEPDAKTTDVTEVETVYPVPDEPPAFSAYIDRMVSGYVVKASFTDFTPDIAWIYMLYSLNGEDWQQTPDEFEWNLDHLGTEDEIKLHELQNQRCLEQWFEPLKNYVAGEIDHFYLKLCIVKQNGLSYESQAAVIERGGLQPIPEGAQCTAYFASEMTITKLNPPSRLPLRYGGFQLTVSADATAEDILALLPDTLPIKVEITRGLLPYASDIVECPVTWKPLSFSQLTAGESITVSDAAEKIVVPAGTRLKTPIGNFELDQALGLSTGTYKFDRVELTVNILPEEECNSTGVLRAGVNGLEIALNQKPAGATAIQAYVITEGESKWTELSGLSLLSDMNAQHATASSGYSLVLRNYQEPYQSYLEAVDAEVPPVPFFVGLKIQGGIYDGKQLILAWPDIYEQLPDLPEVGGSGGNEGNAGAANKDDSTEGGQRPNLPQAPDDEQGEQQPAPQTPSADDSQERQPVVPPIVDNGGQKQLPRTEITDTPETAGVVSEEPVEHAAEQTFSDTQETGQRPNLSQTMPDTTDVPAMNQENGLTPEPLVVQAAAHIKEKENVSDTSASKTAIEPVPVTEQGSWAPLLAVTATASTVATGGCIGAAVFKSAGHGLFRQITGTMRKIFHIKR